MDYKDGYFSTKNGGRQGTFMAWSSGLYDRLDRIYTIHRCDTHNAFPARYDNRHKLNIVVSAKPDKVELTAAWTYTSGNRICSRQAG